MAKKPKEKPKADAPPQQRAAGMLTLQEVARLLMISLEWVRRLHKMGYIPKTGIDQYPLVGTVQGYIRYMKDEDRKAQKNVVESKVREARRLEIEQRMAIRSGDLISLEDAKAEFATFLTITRAELLGFPAAFTRDMEVRRQLEVKIDEILARLTGRYEKAKQILVAGGDPLEAFVETPAGSVGENKQGLS